MSKVKTIPFNDYIRWTDRDSKQFSIEKVIARKNSFIITEVQVNSENVNEDKGSFNIYWKFPKDTQYRVEHLTKADNNRLYGTFKKSTEEEVFIEQMDIHLE